MVAISSVQVNSAQILFFLQLVGDNEPLKVDEASLTGESLAVAKKSGDEVLSGAVVEQGESEAIITAVGGNTFFGKTIKLLSRPEAKGHLQQVILPFLSFCWRYVPLNRPACWK